MREGKFDGPKLVEGYRSMSRIHEPKIGDVLHLPDGSGPWRVVDWALADRVDPDGNVLVVRSDGH